LQATVLTVPGRDVNRALESSDEIAARSFGDDDVGELVCDIEVLLKCNEVANGFPLVGVIIQ